MHIDTIASEAKRVALEQLRRENQPFSDGVLNEIFKCDQRGIVFFTQGILTFSAWWNVLRKDDVIDFNVFDNLPSVLIPARFSYPPLQMSHALGVGRGFIPVNIDCPFEKRAHGVYWNSSIAIYRQEFPSGMAA